MAFRTYVSGLSIDLEDARALVAALPLTDVEVQRRPGLPVLQFQGRKAAVNLTVFGATGRTDTALVERPQAVKCPAGGAAVVAV